MRSVARTSYREGIPRVWTLDGHTENAAPLQSRFGAFHPLTRVPSKVASANIADPQSRQRELVIMPRTRHSNRGLGSAKLGWWCGRVNSVALISVRHLTGH